MSILALSRDPGIRNGSGRLFAALALFLSLAAPLHGLVHEHGHGTLAPEGAIGHDYGHGVAAEFDCPLCTLASSPVTLHRSALRVLAAPTLLAELAPCLAVSSPPLDGHSARGPPTPTC